MRTVKQTTPDKAEEVPSSSDRLIGVPGLGPVRITVLQAAGITTRAQLAQATVEQLISMTGMPRAQAEKALDAVLGTASAATTPPPPTDELMPMPGQIGESDSPLEVDLPEATDPEPEPSPDADLDRALLTARTALADATRRFPELDRPLTKLARHLETLPRRADDLPEKKRAKIAARLDKMTAHLEQALLPARKDSDARRGRLQKSLEKEEEKLIAILPARKRSKHGKRK